MGGKENVCTDVVLVSDIVDTWEYTTAGLRASLSDSGTRPVSRRERGPLGGGHKQGKLS